MKFLVSALSIFRAGARRLFSQSRSQNKSFVNALNKDLINVSEEIYDATCSFKPVVALESATYSHDWPCPDNIKLALQLQDLVRKNGAIPATIGVVEGVATIGLSDREIVDLCLAAGKVETKKVSRRDLPFILGMGIAGHSSYGGTTISATMFLARWAGIHILGTGGIGDLYRGGQNSLDIFSDLNEISLNPMAIVSSGCKSFLDVQHTLEYLETKGSLVATFADGRKGEIDFPVFCSRSSGVKSDLVIEDTKQAAAILFSQARLGCRRNRHQRPGILFANPIPEEFSISKSEMEEVIGVASREADEKGINGHLKMPFVLSRIKDLTQCRSEFANRALIESNVEMAAKIAVQLSLLQIEQDKLDLEASQVVSQQSISSRPATPKFHTSHRVPEGRVPMEKLSKKQTPIISKYFSKSNKSGEAQVTATLARNSLKQEATSRDPPLIVVYGAVAIDHSCSLVLGPKEVEDVEIQPYMKTSNNARIEPTIGGSGHNVALAAQQTNKPWTVRLCSLIADDLPGKMILDALKSEKLDTLGIKILPCLISRSGIAIPNKTAQYVAVSDGKKDLVLGMDDTQIFRQNPYRLSHLPIGSKWAVIDSNWKSKLVRWLMHQLRTRCPEIKIAFDPVSEKKGSDIFRTSFAQSEDDEVPKALGIFPNHVIDLVVLNVLQLKEIFFTATGNGYFKSNEHWSVLDACGILETQSKEHFQEFLKEESLNYEIVYQLMQLLPYMPTIITRLGSKGVLLTEILKKGDPRLEDSRHTRWIFTRTSTGHDVAIGVYIRLYPPIESVDTVDIVNANGASDTFLGVLISGLSRMIDLDEELIKIAQRGEIMSLKSKQTVSPLLRILEQDLDNLCLKTIAKRQSRCHGDDHANSSVSPKNSGLLDFLSALNNDELLENSEINTIENDMQSEESANHLNQGNKDKHNLALVNLPELKKEDAFLPPIYGLPPLSSKE